MSKKLKILVVAQTPPPLHGQAIMTQYFLEGRYPGLELHHVRMAFSEDIQEVGKARVGKVFHLLGLIGRIITARFQIKPDVLYYPPASPNLAPFLRDCALLISVRWLFPKTVFHFHATGISEFQKNLPRPLRWLYRIAYHAPDLSICLSRLAEHDARDFDSKKVVVVPNGIPDRLCIERTIRADRDLATILFLGTVSEEKGVGILLEALALLSKKEIPFRCVIAGGFASSKEELKLKAKCARLNLDARVEWRGPVTGDAKWECFRSADLFCFPTHYRTEGFPVVLLEAMMFSLPIVSTTWRAIPEIVQEGKTGFLTPTQDARATAESLTKLLQDSNLRKSMGRSARSRFSANYTVDTFRSEMEEAILSVNISEKSLIS